MSNETEDEATLAPHHVRYPALPLAFQTSPFVPNEAAPSPVPARPASAAPPCAEPWGMLDVEEVQPVYGVDECALLARDPWTLFLWWEAAPAGIAQARASLGVDGVLVLRMHVAATGVAPRVYDVLLEGPYGRRYLGAPRPGVFIAAALGLRADGGRFAVIARAPRILVPYAEPNEGPIEWMEVAPARSGGGRLEPPAIVQHGSADEVRGAGPGRSRFVMNEEGPAGWPTSPTLSSPGRGRS